VYPILYQYSVFGQQRLVAGYGLMVAAGMLFGLGLALVLARRRGLDVLNVLLVAVIALIAGLVGSFLLFAVTVLPELIRDPSLARAAGLVFYGGPLAAVPAAVIACRRLGVPVLKMADLAAPGLALGHSLGRMGCFLGGCCYGRPWAGPFAVVFTHPLAPAASPALPRHPVQLYESLFLMTATLAMILIWPRSRGAGRLAVGYVGAYALWRFSAEMLRGDVVRGYVIPGWITTSQAISLAILPVAAAGLWWLDRRARQASARPAAPPEPTPAGGPRS
jgi:phosphatidylglycerol:prolipoprotein diacylglycerol transferase